MVVRSNGATSFPHAVFWGAFFSRHVAIDVGSALVHAEFDDTIFCSGLFNQRADHYLSIGF